MRVFNKVIRFFILLSLVMTFSLSEGMTNLSDTIDKAREQEILVQKILKNYIMVGMHNKYNNPEENLKNNILEFEKNMEALDEFATSKKAFKNIEKVISTWEPIKLKLVEPKTIDLAKKLQTMLLELSKIARETTKLYTRQTGVLLGETMDASASLGVDSQKMAMLYLMKASGADSAEIKEQMSTAIGSFETSMTMLKKSNMNTDEMLKTLKTTQRNFLYFKIMDELDSSSIPTLIYKKSNIILEDTKKLGIQYSKSIILN